MNIHEYQAKELFEKFNVSTSKAKVASTPQEAHEIAKKLNSKLFVVKSQIHAGGRGKGNFKNGFKGGVHLCKSPEDVKQISAKMLNNTLITVQTGEEGKLVNKVLIAEAAEIKKELYLAFTIDRKNSCPTIIASQFGGMNIEEVDDDKIKKISIHPTLGLQNFQIRKICSTILPNKSSKTLIKNTAEIIKNLYQLFIQKDCSLLEINPLAISENDTIIALDAKINFDSNALYRHPDIVNYRDKSEEDPREVSASEFNLNYIGLDGNIACMVNGAGLAMATMDIIKHYGGEPANFLDVGGGANEEQVTEAVKILTQDNKVKSVLVNIFGGIMKCDVIAQGIVNATKIVKPKVPLVVRLEGTNVKKGRKILADSGLKIETATDLADASQKAIKLAK